MNAGSGSDRVSRRPTAQRTWRGPGGALWIALWATMVVGCGGDAKGPVGPAPPPPSPSEDGSPVFLSEPVLRPPQLAVSARLHGAGLPRYSATAQGELVYVSARPGELPLSSDFVTIRNPANGAEEWEAVVEGGFDPVPIAAAVGDTLVISGAGGTLFLSPCHFFGRSGLCAPGRRAARPRCR